MRPIYAARGALLALTLATLTLFSGGARAAEVNIYSYRQPFLLEPLLAEFTRRTGVKVNMIYASNGLEERIRQEGVNSPADLLLTADIGRLDAAVKSGLAQPVTSPTLQANIPAELRDPNNMWHGLTLRARVLYVSRNRVKEGEITRYEDLASPEWRGRVCSRSGAQDYNIALLASMIAHHGEEEAEKWLRGVKANLARKPQGNDRAQAKAIWQGECDVALGNTYYMGNMLADPEQAEWAKAVRVVFPNQQDRGAHINLSGVVMTAHAPHRENALRLMEFLSGDEAQRIYAERNFEYPVKPGVAWAPLLRSWGDFKRDPLAIDVIAAARPAAARLVDKVGFDE